MNKMLRKVYSAVTKAADDTTRTLIVTISTDTPDRSGDIVVPKGGDLDNFKKNPVVLYGHDYSGLPIATCIDLEVNDHSITAKVQFPEKGIYELSDIVYEMYKATPPLLSAWSIGFISKESEDVDEDDDENYWFAPQKFTQWEMLEFSAVPVPANPEALTQVRTLGFNPDVVKDAWKELKKKKTKKKEDKEPEETKEVVNKDLPEDEEKEVVVTPEPEEKTAEFLVTKLDDSHINIKGGNGDVDLTIDLKSGRTISAKHEAMLNQAVENIKSVLATAQPQEDTTDDDKSVEPSFLKKLQKELKVQDKSIGLTLRLLKTIEAKEGGE